MIKELLLEFHLTDHYSRINLHNGMMKKLKFINDELCFGSPIENICTTELTEYSSIVTSVPLQDD